MRKVTYSFEQESLISSREKHVLTLRLFWSIAIVGRSLNHKSGRWQLFYFTESASQCFVTLVLYFAVDPSITVGIERDLRPVGTEKTFGRCLKLVAIQCARFPYDWQKPLAPVTRKSIAKKAAKARWEKQLDYFASIACFSTSHEAEYPAMAALGTNSFGQLETRCKQMLRKGSFL